MDLKGLLVTTFFLLWNNEATLVFLRDAALLGAFLIFLTLNSLI